MDLALETWKAITTKLAAQHAIMTKRLAQDFSDFFSNIV